MPLSLPNLDDLRWEDLVAEGRSLIPAFAPDWTDHNPTDPGITLIELFAYESEQLMYQLNRVTDKHTMEFLRLINGREPEWTTGKELPAEETLSAEKVAEWKRAIVTVLREPRRAVTIADFERLARKSDGVARAICIPGRNLQSEDAAAQSERAVGHVSVIVIPKKDLHPSGELVLRVKQTLEPARLLTTRIHVVGPHYVKLGIRVTIVLQRGTSQEEVKKDVINRVKKFFDPLTGWIDKEGWPLGRSVYVSELYQLLGDIEGIESARPSRDSSGAAMDEFVLTPAAPARMKRNPRGELEAVELRPHELLNVTVSPEDILVTPKG